MWIFKALKTKLKAGMHRYLLTLSIYWKYNDSLVPPRVHWQALLEVLMLIPYC